MVYLGELSTEELVGDMFMPLIETPPAMDMDMLSELVDQAAWAREIARQIPGTSFIIGENMVVECRLCD